MNFQILFDESQPFAGQKIQLLEQVIQGLYSGNPGQMAQSQELLGSLEAQTNLWVQTDQIIDNSQNAYTRFFALNCLNKGVATKWSILSLEQRVGIKNYVENLMY